MAMTSEHMEKRIKDAFSNCETAVIDMTGVGSNFEIRLSTPDLADLSRVERHQKVMGLFKTELDSGEVHALTIKYLR